LDEQVETAAGCSVPELFQKGGEPLFRQWERRIVAEEGKRSGAVIATGGGVVLDERNLAPLRQNGRLFFLERSIGKLATGGRPLSTNLEKMYETRLPLYRAFADETVDNDRPLDETVAACLTMLK
jgi:shikimate dehydrogenase